MTPAFKIGPASAIEKILDNRSIFITSPLDLNDPFETRPAWTEEHEARHHADQVLRNSMIRGGPMVVCTEEGIVPAGVMPDMLPQIPAEIDAQYGLADQHNNQVFRKLHARFRVLSFSRSLFDPTASQKKSPEKATLMWSHYGDSFTGGAILFDVDEFRLGERVEVDYSRDRYSLPADFYDTYQALFGTSADEGRTEEEAREAYLKILKSKSPAWDYEDELRIIYDLAELTEETGLLTIPTACPSCAAAKKDRSACSYPEFRHAIGFPATAVRGVVFGTDMHKSATASILSILDAEEYSHVDLYWSCIHGGDYAVQYLKTDKNYIRSMQEIRTHDYNKVKNHFIYTPDGSRIVEAKKGSSVDMQELARRANESNQS